MEATALVIEQAASASVELARDDSAVLELTSLELALVGGGQGSMCFL